LPPHPGKENDEAIATAAAIAASQQQSRKVKQDETNLVSVPLALCRNGDDNEMKVKVPIDPPGVLGGALPLMHHHYSNGHPQHHHHHNDYGVHQQHAANLYGGGGFQTNNNWNYDPNTNVHQQQHHLVDRRDQVYQHQYEQHQRQSQQHRHVVGANHTNHHHHQQQQQWTMPHFLAPLAATVRHPFAFMSSNNGGSNHHDNNWQSNGGNNSYMTNNVQQTQHHTEDQDMMSSDESMNEDGEEGTTNEIEEIKSTFVPSTFAPPEICEKIRANTAARQKAAVPRQTRSMTSKQGRDRRDGSSSKSSKTKSSVAAHQACSPQLNILKGGKIGSGSKVAALLTDGTESDTTTHAPQVMTVLGKRVTMIDAARKIFVVDLISPETCDQIRMMADNHTREIYKSGASTETWRTLYTYTKMDLPVVEVKDMVKKYTDQILHDVKKIVGEIFGGSMKKEAMKLRPRSWKEPHLLLYQRLDNRPDHLGIEMHYDGCDITWSAMMSRSDEYEGGGTYFRCLRKTVKLQQGQVLIHPGELYHKGCEITMGVRTLLVCFTDGMNPKILDDSKSSDDSAEYEKNVLIC